MGFLDRPLTRGFRPVPTQFSLGASAFAPAPYGGINLRDDVSALQPNQARFLDNWLADSGSLRLRNGVAAHASGIGTGEVKTLVAFEGTASEKLLAGGNGNIYDVSAAGTATDLTGALGDFTEDRWQFDNFNNRLFLVNGTDTPLDYNGTAVAATAWTGSGLTITNLVTVANVRNRLWFTENDSADVWYGGIGLITGGLTKFQLSQIASGGKCQAIGSWSRDAGDGQDDLTVFVMSTGQVIVYQGDPAATFSLIGKYGDSTAAPPIGRQCLFKVGGELIIITRLGLVPASALMAAGSTLDFSVIDPWGKIASLIRDEAVLHGGNAGWHGAFHNGIAYINIPQSAGTLSKQVVLVTRTGAWTTHSGWNPSRLHAFQNDLYFGAQTGGFVRKVTGSTDLDSTSSAKAIVATARGAFITPNQGRSNLYTHARPRIQAQRDLTGSVGLDTDFFETSIISDTVTLVEERDTTPWGSAWGSPWGSTPEPVSTWFGVTGDGRNAAVKMQVFSNGETVRWFGTDLLLQPGGIQ